MILTGAGGSSGCFAFASARTGRHKITISANVARRINDLQDFCKIIPPNLLV
ncbi:hypothetical protein SpAn4DRAFT_3373 [Sporomusa ovata]|uniref:Uncharacterized protein n=1 Tax=Sporomusa ovata TaxID=2378 RepID=A0A0U1L184_9FIRM|nr:hypothetical protein SpAn4DRAFT_3373 [Sporomusa ovata]